MPELPEVETVLRTIAPASRGRRVRRVWGSRQPLRGGQPVPVAALRRALAGRRLARWWRRGKYLLAAVEGGRSVLALHLGMSGRLRIQRPGEPRAPHTHLVLGLEGGLELRLVDARRFGTVLLLDARRLVHEPPLAALGPEPLGRGALRPAAFARALARRRGPIKNALLDQRLLAGVGNIYACEALFEAGIDPRRPAAELDAKEAAALLAALRRTLGRAIRHCGTTLRDHADGWGVRGRYQRLLRVYGRAGEPCRRCGAPIVQLVQAARSTFACLRCQR
ncbi:MAG: formamidopyrimidine-DNA glycosylase [Planctomycetota bacterium]|nr:MAG: formamidopyrimidine-DNA glycosylase [Planctomycetota bacterium]